SPTVSFSYIPDVSGWVPDYYRELTNEEGEVIETYSIFQNGIYGTPSLTSSSATMSFRLNNNLEAKVKPKSDTSEELTKVKIIDNFNFSSSANLQDSIIFSPVSFNASTSILKRKLSIRLNGSFDPYAINEDGRRINRAEFKESGKIARLTNAAISMGLNLRGGSGKGDQTEEEPDPIENIPQGVRAPGSEYDTFDEDYYYGDYVDFNIPWSLRVDYSLRYSKPRQESSVIQTLRLSGDFSLTPKWKIGFNTGYDFKSAKVTTSNLSIYRDLHCWEMRLTAVPFGKFKSFNFQINAKSAILQDLKYNKRIPWQDNF
ncbi:MAG: putative LPS assembly protein LptD, partial [Bacteroidales bacterium]